MALDAAFVIRTGSAALWVVMGLAILALARRRENAALGALSLGFGSVFVSSNISFEAGRHALLVDQVTVLLLLAFGVSVFAVAWTMEGVPLAPVVAAGSAAAAWLILGPKGDALPAAIGRIYDDPAMVQFSTTVSVPIFAAVLSLLLGLLIGVALAQRNLPAADPRRASRRLLLYSFGLYMAYAIGANLIAYGWSVFAVLFPLLVALAAALLLAGAGPGGRGERNAALIFLAVALLGAAAESWTGGLTAASGPLTGTIGAFRIAGVAVLGYAVFRRDLLGVTLPRLAERRGALTMASLAALFIVAQIAQEFLSAQYGLLMGGVVAGALLFAANPIQRALEERRSPRTASGPTLRAEEAYRKALRLALRDRRLSREEELQLHELAGELGITGARAHAILVEVEGERPGAGR